MQSWLFTGSEEWASTAAQLGIPAVRRFETNSHGTPCLGYMFQYVANHTRSYCGDGDGIVFDAFVNCDLVFTKSLVDTLEEIRRI